MKNVKSLYFHLGRIHCPAHGHLDIQFGVAAGTLGWACMAQLPNGTTCRNRAKWTSCSSIRDDEIRALAEHLVRNTTNT